MNKRKWKQLAAFLLSFIMCLQVMVFTVFAGSKISINNVMLCFETVAVDDVAMVSLRDIYQCFGATVTWQADTQEIVVTSTDKVIKFKVNSATATLNDVPVALSHAVIQQDGITYIPVNFVATSLDAPINWNIADGIVEFTANPEQTQVIQERNNTLAAEKAEKERQRQAEIARQEEIARQQAEAEQQRQAEIARQQAEQQRQQQAAAQATVAPRGDTVYVTRTGKKYHYNSSCNGGTYYESTLDKARSRGLTPCNKCAK